MQLTFEQRCVVHELFAGGLQPAEVAGPLAAYLVLFSLAGPEARTGAPAPQFTIDVFTLWNAAGPELRAYLRRRGETIVCPELGTRWTRAA